jgi:endonuclease G
MRVTVFTGPVLRDDDPKRSYIQVPREYWKIVVRVEDGELLATAVLADQSDLLKEGGEALRREDLPAIPKNLAKVEQCSIQEIEELTRLNFGSLREHDTYHGGAEGAGTRRLIRDYQDLQIRLPNKRS